MDRMIMVIVAGVVIGFVIGWLIEEIGSRLK